MSVTRVESLNKNALLNIFEFLDASNLKKCSLVCKRWNDVISTSSSTMRRLPLLFMKSWKEKASEAEMIKRHHHTIRLNNIEYDGPELIEIVSKLGSNVRLLELNRIKIIDNSFPKLLNALPMLEKIIFNNCVVYVRFDEKFEAENLKTLMVIGRNLDVFDLIGEIQFKTLKIATVEPTKANIDSFVRILKRQKGLTDLALRLNPGKLISSFYMEPFDNGSLIEALGTVKFDFYLKKLSLDFLRWGENSFDDRAFIKFLKAQQSTLEDLEIGSNSSKEILEVIMKDLKLKRLILYDICRMNFNTIPQNHHLKTLQINGQFVSLDTALGLLHIYSSVEKLVIKNWSNDIVNGVIVFIPNLKCLQHFEIHSLTRVIPEITIPSLKTLHVHRIDGIDSWQSFLVNNPSLETIAVKFIPRVVTITHETLDAITQRLPLLKHVKFGGHFMPTQEMLEMMHRNCPDLQSLEVFNLEKKKHKNRKLQGDFLSLRCRQVGFEQRANDVVG